MVNYCRRFIRGYAQNIVKLYALLKKNVPWNWCEEVMAEFVELRHSLCSASVLRLPDPNRHFVVSTDASSMALGVVLL
jgi:hypothetical protein